jgi:hypothetical protein
MMLAELCRALAAAFQVVPFAAAAPMWWQKQGNGGAKRQTAPLGQLERLLRDVDRSVADGGLGELRDGLAAYGDGFCVFSSYGCGESERVGGSGRGGEGEKEVGLLHCGDGSGNFLMIDFEARSLRAVECRLAGMRPNAAEPRKLDLIIARESNDGGNNGAVKEEELFRLAAAPRDVAAFWVKYAMGDD